MRSLQSRQQKIQEKRKQTPRREFVKEICSIRGLLLYKNEGHISRYPVSDRHGKLISSQEYEHYGGDFLSFGIDAQVGIESFFKTFVRLVRKVPFGYLLDYGGNEHAAYADLCYKSRNCYLSSIVINDCENICYSYNVKDGSTNIISSLMVWNGCENVYMSMGVINSYNIFFSRYVRGSSDVWFSSNLVGCTHCICCNNLTNQSYCIANRSYDKEAYYQLKAELLELKSSYSDYWSQIEQTGINYASANVVGNFCSQCEDVQSAYNCFQVKQGKNCFLAGGPDTKEFLYDVFSVGAGMSSNHLYGVCGCGLGSNHIYCSTDLVSCQYIFYSMNLDSCSYCLGCIGLRNKSYCILNKQYTKEERYRKVDEMFSQMEEEGVLGGFFPGWINPFYFNDTAAYLIEDSFTKEEVIAEGYLRRDEKIKVDIPEGVEVVDVHNLADYEGWMINGSFLPLSLCDENTSLQDAVWSIHPSILKKVVCDAEGNYYRIIPMEYKFLKKHGLPLPRLHWLARLKQYLQTHTE